MRRLRERDRSEIPLLPLVWSRAATEGRGVLRYFGDDPQVRFSVWDDGVARAAVSLGEDEALRLAEFLEQIESSARHRSAVSDTCETL